MKTDNETGIIRTMTNEELKDRLTASFKETGFNIDGVDEILEIIYKSVVIESFNTKEGVIGEWILPELIWVDKLEWYHSGGGCWHFFLETTDHRWLGIHMATGYVTISQEPYSNFDAVLDAWSEEQAVTDWFIGHMFDIPRDGFSSYPY